MQRICECMEGGEEKSVCARTQTVPDKITISGIIKDNAGDTIPGAKVSIGTTQAVSTDINGRFKMENIDRNATVTISSTGCTSVKKKATELQDQNIRLKCTSIATVVDSEVSPNSDCDVIGKKECNSNYKICEKDGEKRECLGDMLLPHTTEGKCTAAGRNGYKICISTKCEEGYAPSSGFCKKKANDPTNDTPTNDTPTDDTPTEQQDDCAKSGGTLNANGECECSGDNLKQSDDKKMCVATEPTNEETVDVDPIAPVETDCTTSGGTMGEDGKCVCDAEKHLVINEEKCECADGYERNSETNECMKIANTVVAEPINDTTNTQNTESVPDEPSALEKAEDKLKKAKEKEQSLANRTLTAATTAATGLGMMTAASARAEQKADADAEQDMTAYLATFKCEYGRGLTAKAGNEEITLPGGNELLEYYSEYKSLADNLKNTKKALGLRPGIEQEIVYDKAQSNLYKYSSTGITQGAFTSLSRALTDTEGADAEKWNTQKEESSQKLKGGAVAAGAGVAGGVVGNAAMNTDMIQNIKDVFKK